MSFERADIDRFRDAISRRLGLRVDDNRLDDVSDVLRERMAALRTGSVEQYLSRFETSREELRAVASRLTVCETYFFRIPDHYRVLGEIVLPDRIRAQSPGRYLRILSAGSSSGEEAYSVAMLIRENLPELQSWQVDIHGIDVNPVVIARARRACYSEWSLREMPAKLKERYFRRVGKEFHLSEAIREMVTFQEGNLLDPGASFWMREAYDIILSRNVLMYFGPDAAEAVVSREAECLMPAGYLFLGPAETLRGLSNDFHLCHTHEVFYYRRREQLNARSPSRAARKNLPVALPLEPPAAAGAGMAPPEVDKTLFESIGRASQRIQALAQNPSAPRTQTGDRPMTGSTVGARSGWDVGRPLELLRQERFGDALTALNGMPSESREDRDVQLLRAVLLINSGDVSEAERACKQLLATNELNAGAHYLLALCREHAGDREAAIEHDRIAVYLDPAFAMPHLHLGLLSKRSGQIEAARHELQQASVLLSLEDSSRILLFGGGFGREPLIDMCRREVAACGGTA